MSISNRRNWFLFVFAAWGVQLCTADVDVWGPFPGGALATNMMEITSLYPFLVKQAGGSAQTSMRYQQVYSSSLFNGLYYDVYLYQLRFILEALSSGYSGGPIGWTIPSMQINLSTTARDADALSPVLSENVGPDDTVVFGPKGHIFGSAAPDGYLIFRVLEKSFHYNPSRGNLLLDVRIFDGSGPFDANMPALEGFDLATDGVSRAWSSNGVSSLSGLTDTTGLTTLFRFGPDYFLTVPAPRAIETNTLYPFLINQDPKYYYDNTNTVLSTRYQQVYTATLFTNLSPDLIFITSLTFLLESAKTNYYQFTWTITNLQVRLSTTSRSAGGLSAAFGENVGPDETLVFSGTNQFQAIPPDGLLPVYLSRPFTYNPAKGNLLLDVQLTELAGPAFTSLIGYSLAAFDTPPGQASRIWSTNMTARVATGIDNTGLTTIFQFSPVPSLRAQFFAVDYDGQTNMIDISWPSQPSVFQLQWADHLAADTIWQPARNQILGSPQAGGRFIRIPAASGGVQGFYRLVWPGGG